MTEKFKSHILNLYMLALSDGNFASEELELILKIAEEKGFSKEDFEKIISNPTGIQFHIPESFIDKIKLLYNFVRIILADGVIEEDEKTMFFNFCKKFSFEQETSEELFDWLMELSNKKLSSKEIEQEIDKLLNE